MDLLYGTYLRFKVQDLFLKQQTPLSIKEIEAQLHQYPTKRERTNFRNRIRTSLNTLIQQGIVKREIIYTDSNLLFHKYAINNEIQS